MDNPLSYFSVAPFFFISPFFFIVLFFALVNKSQLFYWFYVSNLPFFPKKFCPSTLFFRSLFFLRTFFSAPFFCLMFLQPLIRLPLPKINGNDYILAQNIIPVILMTDEYRLKKITQVEPNKENVWTYRKLLK